MNFDKRQVIHLAMEKENVKLMSSMKAELRLNSFAEVQEWLLRSYQEGRITPPQTD